MSLGAAIVPPVLATRGVSKRYAATQALRNVDLAFHGGCVHAVVGENGAGKSTLTRILTGAAAADAGEVLVDGVNVPLRDPMHAQRLGIRIVHQHDTLVPNLSVAENIVLGQWPRRRRFGWIDVQETSRRAGALLKDLGHEDIPLKRPAGDLSAAQRQIVEIAKAISLSPRVLILDEPTASLAHADIEHLFGLVRRLREGGTAIVYISHRLDEIFELANQVTVLRDGAVTASLPVADTDKKGLIRLMVGRSLDELFPKRQRREPPQPALVVRDLARDDAFGPVSFEVKAGEIVGLYGLVGSGRSELARCLFGADRATRGVVSWQDRPLTLCTPRDALRAGIALLTEDRLGDGLVRGMSVRDNATLACKLHLKRLSVIDARRQRSLVLEQVRQLGVRPPDIERDVATLSGGNQQKVVLGKWLLSQARLLILDEPTRGVDVGARCDIYEAIASLADAGMAVLLISSDLPEVIGMSQRLLVMRAGRIAGTFQQDDADEERLLACASGVA
jgi:ribose transport system ATP-binding protein